MPWRHSLTGRTLRQIATTVVVLAVLGSFPSRWLARSGFSTVFLASIDEVAALRATLVAERLRADPDRVRAVRALEPAAIDSLAPLLVGPLVDVYRARHALVDRHGAPIVDPSSVMSGALAVGIRPALAGASSFAGTLNGVDGWVTVHPIDGSEWSLVTYAPAEAGRALLRPIERDNAAIGTLASCVILGAIAWIVRRRIARPLTMLMTAVERVGTGLDNIALSGTLLRRPDEIGHLARAFEAMARRIAAQSDELGRRIALRTAELASSEERYRRLHESAPEAVYVLDPTTACVVSVNTAFAALIGMPREAIAGMSAVALSAPYQLDGRPSADVAAERIRDTLANDGPVVFEWVVRTATGRDVVTEIRAVPLPMADGRVLVRGTVIDISQRKQAEEELLRTLAQERELGEMRQRFVSTVSHEFRTPLAVIHSSVEILERYHDRLPVEARVDHLQTVANNTRHLAGMIEEVLLLSRVDAGRLAFAPKSFMLRPFIEALVASVEAATDARCPIVLDLADIPPSGYGDEVILRHVITNLLSNAVKYSEAGSPVRLHVMPDGPLAVMTIVDQGVGIDPDDQIHLFTAFQRGRNVGERTGTGLGLAIVKRVLALHGGAIAIESVVGQGTTVTVRVPLLGGPPAPM